MPVLRYFLHVLVYEPAARAILRVPPPPPLPASKNKKKTQQSGSKGGASSSSSPLNNNSTTIAQRARAAAELARASDPRQKLVARFTESAWKLSVYVFLLLLGAWAIGGEPWSGVLTALPWGGGFGSGKGSGKRGAAATAATAAAAADALWLGWPLAAPPLRLSLYYLAEGAFYLASLFMLLHWEVKRKDFAAMLTHHGEISFLKLFFEFFFLNLFSLSLSFVLTPSNPFPLQTPKQKQPNQPTNQSPPPSSSRGPGP